MDNAAVYLEDVQMDKCLSSSYQLYLLLLVADIKKSLKLCQVWSKVWTCAFSSSFFRASQTLTALPRDTGNPRTTSQRFIFVFV